MRLLHLLLALSTTATCLACQDDAGPNGPPDAGADAPVVPHASDAPQAADAADAADAAGETGESGDTHEPAEVSPEGPAVVTLLVTPPNASAPPGISVQMRATAVHSDGSSSDVTGRSTWTSSLPLVATIGASGLVVAIMSGQTVISASYQGIPGSTDFTVTTVATTGITIAPVSAAIAQGEARMFTATLGFSNGTSQDITELAEWSIEHPTIATVDNQAGQRGLVQAVAAGQTTLRAMSIGHTGTATIIVTGH
jgi:hypothetical protein